MSGAAKELPKEFLSRLERIVPQGAFKDILPTFSVKKPVFFWINTIKIEREDFLSLLGRYNVRAQKLPWWNGALKLEHPSLRALQETPLYKNALIYIQGISSMIPVNVLNPSGGDVVLDMCAAPGGKTLQLASRTRNSAEIIAIEKVRKRYYKLKDNIFRYGVKCKEVLRADAGYALKYYKGACDKILLDAPCSSEARFLTSEPKTFSYWSRRKIHESSHTQKRLIISSVKALKKGARLVYCTCSFSPEENEAVVDAALKRHKGIIELEPVPVDFLKNTQAGLLEWGGKRFSRSLSYTVRVLPTHEYEGFYIASLRRVK